jgi:hypothetical protein
MRSVVRPLLSAGVALPAVGLLLVASGWVAAQFWAGWRDWLSVTYAIAPWLSPIAAATLVLALLFR